MFALLKNVWLRVDGFVLSKCQNFFNYFQQGTGRINFSTAKMLSYLSLLACLILIFSTIFYDYNLLPLILLMFLATVVSYFLIKRLERIILASPYYDLDKIDEMRRYFKFGRQLWLIAFFIDLFLIVLILIIKENAPTLMLPIWLIHTLAISISLYFASIAINSDRGRNLANC